MRLVEHSARIKPDYGPGEKQIGPARVGVAKPRIVTPTMPMPTLYEQLRADIITAVKARDAATATSLRTADATIQRASMDLSKPIDDALVIATVRKGVKNLADARLEFEK